MRLAHLTVFSFSLLFLLAGCADYGESIEYGKSSLYYKDGVTAEEAGRLGEFLKANEVLTEDEQTAAQVVRTEGATIVRLAPPKGVKLDDKEFLAKMDALKKSIAKDVFPGEYVRLQITDENCVPVAAITDYGRRLDIGEITLFYADGVTEEEAKKLAGQLGGAEGVREHQMVKAGDAYVLRFAIGEDTEIDDAMRDAYRGLGKKLGENGIADGILKLELTDEKFETLEAITDKKKEEDKDESESD